MGELCFQGGNEVPEWIYQLGLGTLIGIVAYFLKSYKTEQGEFNNEQKNEIDRIDKELQAYKLEAADRYVHKDDFIRATTQTDRKLDKIYDELMKLTSNNAGGKG